MYSEKTIELARSFNQEDIRYWIIDTMGVETYYNIANKKYGNNVVSIKSKDKLLETLEILHNTIVIIDNLTTLCDNYNDLKDLAQKLSDLATKNNINILT